MNQYKFTLQPYGNGKNTRFTCPSCHKKGQFTRYIDTETGDYLNDVVGICNRQVKCGYHYTPKQFFVDYPEKAANGDDLNLPRPLVQQTKDKSPVQGNHQVSQDSSPLSISLMPEATFKESRKHYERNNLIRFLNRKFGSAVTEKLISQYHIGTSKRWPGATVFWQIDQQARVRAGKIILFNPETGKRIKKPRSHISWAHTALGLKDYRLSQCLFGEHLVRLDITKPVAIVESEKTAIVCSVYLPKYIWLASGGLSNLTSDRCQVLDNRHVTLFPDLGGFDRWSQKAKELHSVANINVSDILEQVAIQEQRRVGLDIADYLLEIDIKRIG